MMYPERGICVDKIMDWVFAICDEYSWCLPAHQGTLGPNDNSRIDLFASETGFNLAIVYTLLGDRLDEALICRFNTAIDGFLGGFKDDGVCLEGCGYWAYGVGFFVQYADMIRTFTGGRVDYFKIPKVKSIAAFPQKMFLSGNAAVSFADGNRMLNYTTGIMHRLKTEYPDDVLIYDPKYGAYGMGCGRACVWIFGAAWTVEEFWQSPAENTAFESYAGDSQWYVYRADGFGFAAKAGNNNELHNHNDVGSFIFAKSGKQMLCDLGSGLYTRQYFSSERYTILECASFGHSVPLIAGESQPVGADAKAVDVSWREGEFSFDMAGAYNVPELKSLKRSFKCCAEGVTLTDEYIYEGEGELVERFVSVVEPRLASEGVLAVGEPEVRFDPAVCTLEIVKTAGTAGHNKDVFLIDFKLGEGVRRFACGIC